MARLTTTSAWTAFVALSVGAGCSSQTPNATAGAGAADPGVTSGGNTVGSGGHGGAGNTAVGPSVTSAVATNGNAVVAVGAGGSGGGPFVCDPPAPAGSLYAISAYGFGLPDPISMCQYRDKVLLVVDTAAL